MSFLEQAPAIAPDAIFEVTKRYVGDADSRKVNLGQGTYRDGDGQPWVLPSVRMAKEAIGESGHEYLQISGLPSFREAVVRLVFRDLTCFKEERIAACQALSGTGALLLAGLAISKISPGPRAVYITSPTWSNHDLLFRSLGFDVRTLPYYKNRAFNFDGYMETLRLAPRGSVIVLHPCAHNPTGCDPTREQWKIIGQVMKELELFPIFDAAYLGFNSGSIDEDAWAIRYFIEDLKLEASVCVSFAKNMGLYGERVGLVSFVAKTPEVARNVFSVLENVQRATVSSPPRYGSQIASTVLSSPEISEQWAKDLITMSGRIRTIRRRLYDSLLELGTPGDWSHIVSQSGMFGYLGLTPAQVEYLEAEYHVYMANTSRISIAGLNEHNVEYFAKAIDSTVKTVDQ